eukprot:s2118_g10.t1
MGISEEQRDSIQVKTLRCFWDVTGSFPMPGMGEPEPKKSPKPETSPPMAKRAKGLLPPPPKPPGADGSADGSGSAAGADRKPEPPPFPPPPPGPLPPPPSPSGGDDAQNDDQPGLASHPDESLPEADNHFLCGVDSRDELASLLSLDCVVIDLVLTECH